MLRIYLKLIFIRIACTGIFLTHFVTQTSWAENSVSYYRQQGLAYRYQKLYPQAIAALEKSVKLAPQDINGRIILGWTLHLAGNHKQAERSLFQALYINPFSVQACNALGIVYLVQGDLIPAVGVHNWAAILKPDNEIAYYNLSLAYHRLGFFNWAIANADIAIKLEPSNPHPLVAKALAAWDQGDRTWAKQIFKQAINLDSRYADTEFLNYLEEAGFSTGQIALSKKILRLL
ncbi:tetratricopeptide repeat protein [Synechococcus sp. PCC 7502]|uniref:tetratricopeptide repeat protein n=1 Tax=Synechococcus sp. PCC 7502 TaxID=1173263 RepID=UPI00029FD474|nr:tetratricopeptide repeat protein [Synechococcus sp. PCC 7502]AFY74448.1 tetratricopeptide repeat protein [Synechococcus sp. PCC 7502]